jgi:hypothetical protein
MRRRWYRELIDEIREENRARREEHERPGIQANTEGLLRVLDEFRRNHGPAAAGA